MNQKPKPSSLQECLQLFAQASHNFGIQKLPKRVILLMGSSKAGKTTLLYYLLGKELKMVTNQLGVSVLQSQAIYHGAYIGAGYDSTTVYPNIPPDCGVQDLIIIDMPGLDDTRPTFKLVNLYILLEILSLIQEVHVCQVIQELFVGDDELLEEILKICSFINKKILTTEKAVSLVITKVEEEQCLQKLQNTLEYLWEETQNKEIAEELQAFRANKKYIFRSEQPKIQEGLQLKNKIIEDSFFTAINKNPLNFLSPTFCNHMIGESRLEEFQQYLKALVIQAEQTILNLISFVAAILNYEYSDIIYLTNESNRQQDILSQLYENIKQKKESIFLNQINATELLQFTQPTMNKQKHIGIFKLFEIKHNYPLGQCVLNMSSVFENVDGWSILSPNLANSIRLCLKELASLLKILKSIDSNQLRPVTDLLVKNYKIQTKIQQFQDQWRQISTKLLNNSNSLQLLSDEDILKAYTAYFGAISVKQITVTIRTYKQLKKQEVKQLLSSSTGKPRKKMIHNRKITSSSMSLEEIQNLSNNVFSLQFILQKISIKPQLDEEFSRAFIKKASTIFACFSYYEQAIMFAMAVSDHKAISQLLQLGILYSQLSNQFIRQIMLKYYLNSSFNCYQEICLCYRFLFQSAQSQQQFNQLYNQFTQEALKQQSLEKMAPKENIPPNSPIQRLFIEPILNQREQLVESLKQLQNQFEACSAIFSSAAISQIMK